MKNKILTIVLLITCFCSCNGDFLERNALNQLSEGSFWKSENDAIVGVNSIYNTLKEFTNEHCAYGLLDDFSDISYYSWSHQLISDSYTSRGGMFATAWKMLYKGINRANTAISHIDEIEMSTDMKNRLMGEAKFMRALFYFKLWDLYGGVPIYDIPVNYDEAYKPRNSEEEVRDFILKDLTDAYELLPDSYTNDNRGRATKWAALSLRGKTYLYGKIWEKAADDLENVIKNSGHDLHPEYYQIFNFKWEDNKEVIFDVQYIMVEGYGNPCDIRYGNRSAQSQGWQQTFPTPSLVDEYEMADGTPFSWDNFKIINGEPFDPNNEEDWQKEDLVKEIFKDRDPRLLQTVLAPWQEFIGAGNKTLIYKWPYDPSDPSCFMSSTSSNAIYCWKKFVHQGDENNQRFDSPNNIPVIRFADVLLMYAEAKNEQSGPDQTVYESINRVRARVRLPDIPKGTQDEIRKRIQHERMVEFAGEGIRYSDIRRWKIGIDVCNHDVKGFNGKKMGTRKFTERNYLWAIPEEERDLNPAITQNSGW